MKKNKNVKEILRRNSITNYTDVSVKGGHYETYVLYQSGGTTNIVNAYTNSPSAVSIYSGGTYLPSTDAYAIFNMTNGNTVSISGLTDAKNIDGVFYINDVKIEVGETTLIGGQYYTYLGKSDLGFTIMSDDNTVYLVSIAITPSTNLYKGLSQSMVATGSYTVGSDTNISSRVLWSVDDSSVATITNDGALTAVKEGTVTVSAKFDTLKGDVITGTVDVTIPTISIMIVTGDTTAKSGLTTQFISLATYNDASIRNTTTGSTWSLSGLVSGATINQYGYLTAGFITTGITITAAFDGLTATKIITVIP